MLTDFLEYHTIIVKQTAMSKKKPYAAGVGVHKASTGIKDER